MAIENVNEKRNKIDGTVFESKTILVDGRVYKIVEDDTNFGTTDTIIEAARPYNVYTALLTQTGTAAPTAVVVENTFTGSIVWTRQSAGNYIATLSGAFPEDKTVVFFADTGSGAEVVLRWYWTSENTILVGTGGTDYETEDGKISIEIRVYN